MICTVGDPSRWDNVEYIYEGSSFFGKCTLPILLNKAVPKPETIIVIVLDTMIDTYVSSYNELVNKVTLKYNRFFDEIGLKNSVKLIVAPGTGRFQPIGGIFFNFVGKLSDYYAYIMYELSKILAEANSDVTIHLDLTHGINFMPSLALLAVKEIASILALTRESVRLKIYNTEPYIKNVTTKLNIHLIDDLQATVEYDLVPLGAEGKCDPLKPCDKGSLRREEDLRALESTCDRMKKQLNAFLSSVFNGLPLALYTFYPDATRLENIIENLVEIWRENISVTSNGNEICIKRALSFSRDFIKLIQVWLIAKTLHLEKKTEVSYEELESLRKNFFSKFSVKIENMISRDLHLIKEEAEKKREHCGDWTKLHTILNEGSKEFSERNFLAHSGLERNVTEIKCDSQSIMLRYAKEEIEKVIEGCLHGLAKVSKRS